LTQFWKLRLSTLAWGFVVLYAFTRRLDVTSQAFLVQVVGNTVIMRWFTRQETLTAECAVMANGEKQE
jgi:hypothetical protein